MCIRERKSVPKKSRGTAPHDRSLGEPGSALAPNRQTSARLLRPARFGHGPLIWSQPSKTPSKATPAVSERESAGLPLYRTQQRASLYRVRVVACERAISPPLAFEVLVIRTGRAQHTARHNGLWSLRLEETKPRLVLYHRTPADWQNRRRDDRSRRLMEIVGHERQRVRIARRDRPPCPRAAAGGPRRREAGAAARLQREQGRVQDQVEARRRLRRKVRVPHAASQHPCVARALHHVLARRRDGRRAHRVRRV